MKASWKNTSAFINDLSLRERRLLCITSAVVCIGIIAAVIWRPLIINWNEHAAKNAQVNMAIASLQDNIEQLKSDFKVDVNAPYVAQLNGLKAVVTQQHEKIHTITSALINPKKMGSVFAGLLKETNVTIENVSNLDAQPIEIADQDVQSDLLYKHSLSINMAGQYMDALKYLQEIEKQAWKLYWDELTYKTENYPNGKLFIKVHTLSTSENVLVF